MQPEGAPATRSGAEPNAAVPSGAAAREGNKIEPYDTVVPEDAIDVFNAAMAANRPQRTAASAASARPATISVETDNPDFAHTPVSGFDMNAGGLWRSSFDRDGNTKGPTQISGPFAVLAHGRDQDSEGWGLLLRWRDREGVPHEWFMPQAMLAGEAAELRARLQDGGLYIHPTRAAREALLVFLSAQTPPNLVRTTPSIGWVRGRAGGYAFVLPDRVFGKVQGERVVPTGDLRAARQRFASRGTLAGWKRRVGAHCVGNSRLLLAVSVAFAAALLTPMDHQTGAVNLRGRAQIGKSTAAKAAGSVWGPPEGKGSYVLRWRASDNGLEAMASDFNDCPMILDELGQADVKSLGESIYMLANEQGKLRASRSAEARGVATWRLLVLSTGEKSVSEMIAAAGKPMTAGQEVRMVDVPADAGAGLGLFETTHGLGGPGDLAAAMLHGGVAEHGTAGPAFVAWLAGELERDDAAFLLLQKKRLQDFLDDFLPLGADPQVRSVAQRFGIIALGGELATTAGVTGWPARAAWHAAGTCFGAWLTERGAPTRPREEIEAFARIRDFIDQHGQARFQLWPGPAPEENKALNQTETAKVTSPQNKHETTRKEEKQETGNGHPAPEGRAYPRRAGYRRWIAEEGGAGHFEYYFNASAWKEALAGLDARAAARALHDAGYLQSRTAGKDGHITYSRSYAVPGHGQSRLYHIAPKILTIDETAIDETEIQEGG